MGLLGLFGEDGLGGDSYKDVVEDADIIRFEVGADVITRLR